MNPQKKLTVRQAEEQQAVNQQQTQQQPVREFATVEEMLRHDAMHTLVPPSISHRLQDSVSQLPKPARPGWWRRLLGGSNK